MTQNDAGLLRAARKTSYWDYQEVYNLAELADSERVAQRIRNIGDILRDIAGGGYRV